MNDVTRFSSNYFLPTLTVIPNLLPVLREREKDMNALHSGDINEPGIDFRSGIQQQPNDIDISTRRRQTQR